MKRMMRHRGGNMGNNKKHEVKHEEKDEVKDEEVVETVEDVKTTAEEENEISEVELLQAQIKDLENEASEWKTNYYKVFADMENTKRRLQSEHQNALKFMMQDFSQDLLPVIDNLERAIKVEEASEEIKNFLKGFEMINKQFLDILSKHGIEEIKALDEEFDPNFHQAVMTCNEDGIAENIIVEELQKGYTINGRVLRASMVKVNQK